MKQVFYGTMSKPFKSITTMLMFPAFLSTMELSGIYELHSPFLLCLQITLQMVLYPRCSS